VLLDFLELRSGLTCPLCDPLRERSGVVLLGNALLLDAAVELGQVEGGVVPHSYILSVVATFQTGELLKACAARTTLSETGGGSTER
jgi:hypothetical protein